MLLHQSLKYDVFTTSFVRHRDCDSCRVHSLLEHYNEQTQANVEKIFRPVAEGGNARLCACRIRPRDRPHGRARSAATAPDPGRGRSSSPPSRKVETDGPSPPPRFPRPCLPLSPSPHPPFLPPR